MPKGEKLARKNAYFAKLINLVETTPTALIVEVDHVGSKLMQEIRMELRGQCIVLMGKNTMIRTALRKRIEETEDEGLATLLSNINGNIGFIFCKEGSLEKARKVLEEKVVPAAAKAGAVSPKDVYLSAGNSGLEPSSTSFFQALNIQTKIVKGSIEIVSDFHICKLGERVTLSAQALLTKLGQKPFEYGMKVRSVYQDGSVFDAAVLDITDDVIMKKFMKGVTTMAAFGRAVGIPTECGLPHAVAAAYRNMIALVLDIDVADLGFTKADEVKAILSDPEALAAMQAAAASGPASGGAAAGGNAGAAAPAAAAAVEEEEEDMDFDLFD
jgi:large subunit ribosomal protein LP0